MKHSYSTEGDDIIAHSILRNIEQGFYIDVGCNHPTYNSNTFYFYKKGWNGIGIDANSEFKDLWKIKRPKDKFLNTIISSCNKREKEFYYFDDSGCSTANIDVMNRYRKKFKLIDTQILRTQLLMDIIKSNNIKNINLLNIDIEGCEFDIIQTIDYTYIRPSLIIIEEKNYNLKKPSLINEFLTKYKYTLICKNLLNSFYVDSKSILFKYLPSNMLIA